MLTSLPRLASAAALLAISSSLPLAGQEPPSSESAAEAAPAAPDRASQDPEAQGPGKPAVANPSIEGGEVGAAPPGWRFSSQTGGVVKVVNEGAAAGARAALIDATSAKGRGMSNLMQTIDAAQWRGKRVRYRAAVRTAALGDGVGAQLWCRVDRPKGEGGEAQLGAFDNMRARPISGATWERYDIVLDVAADATQIALGLFVLGDGKVWLDDVTLEAVDLTVATTAMARTAARRSRGSYRMPAAVRTAMATAEDAPQQPFWTWWLVLPVLAAGLFFAGMWPRPATPPAAAPDGALSAPAGGGELGLLRVFALRFTVCYWLLYCLPGPLPNVLSSVGRVVDRAAEFEWLSSCEGWSEPLFWLSRKLSTWSRAAESWMAHRTGEWCFGFEGDLVPPNGSGDTTMSYLIVLDWFVVAAALAAAWTLLRRRAPRRDAAVDLTRSYLRYVLAFAMLGYGLAKVSMTSNQFPEISAQRLDQSWGETSPMGLVWGFMGASRPYTIFAGLGEVVAAFFLLWRHTALLGAVVAVAVMTNVLMLNYCYDVPVKIYSTHLTLMGLIILAPDARRLLSLLIWNRNPEDQGTPDVWKAAGIGWLRWLMKFVVVSACFLLPIGERAWELMDAEAPAQQDDAAGARAGHLLVDRGYRWINEVPFNR